MSKAEIISEIPKLSHQERREIMRVISELEDEKLKENPSKARFVKENGFTVVETEGAIDETMLKEALREFP